MLESSSSGVAVAPTPPAVVLPAHVVLGSRALRIVATLIDVLALLFPVFVVTALSGSYALGGVLYVLGSLFYAPLLLMRSGTDNGHTIGKETLGLRVVPLSGGQLTPHSAFLRELVGRSLLNIFTLGLYGFIDTLWCLFDPHKQTLHDKIAHTIVIRDKPQPHQAP